MPTKQLSKEQEIEEAGKDWIEAKLEELKASHAIVSAELKKQAAHAKVLLAKATMNQLTTNQ